MITYAVMIRSHKGLAELPKHFGNSTYSLPAGHRWFLFDQTEPIENVQIEELDAEGKKIIKKAKSVFSSFTASNVRYERISQETSEADCYNRVLSETQDGLICFTNDAVLYTVDAPAVIEKTAEAFPEEQIFSTRFRRFDAEFHQKRYKEDTAHIEVLDETDQMHLFIHACFFRAGFAKKEAFRDICQEETGHDYLLRLCLKRPSLVLLDHVTCQYTKKLSRQSDRHYGCNNKKYYLDAMRGIYLPMLKSFTEAGQELPEWLKKEVYYQLYYRYYANLNVRHKFLLNPEEVAEFKALTKELLAYYTDAFIMDNQKKEQLSPPFVIRNLFAYIKHDGDEKQLDRKFFIENGQLFFSQCGVRYDLSNHQDLKVKAINLRDRRFCLDMRFFTHLLYDYAPEAIYAECNGVRYNCVHTDYYALDKIFGESVEKSYCFYVEFPIDELIAQESRICFFMEIDGQKIQLPLFFHRAPSKLNNMCDHAYWMLDQDHMMTYEDHSLVFRHVTQKEVMDRERAFIREAIRYIHSVSIHRKTEIRDINDLIHIRKAYYRKRDAFRGRRIWLYFDKLYKAGDNGEYAFHYAYHNDPSIESYYIVNKDAPDYERLKQEYGDRILIYGSFKCKLYALMAETIIATHPDIIEFLGFKPKMASLFKDLFNPYLVCIAHGVTIQKNADYQNRLYDNTMFYTTSSKYEVKHILQPIYGYHEDEVALTGMARFDGLHNHDQKQILITPTWRRNLVGAAERNSTREYSERFKQTDYYRIYNSLINDNRIIETAKKTGYKVIFLLHPSMSAQIDDYDRNDYVELIPASGNMSYEKILTESSLMITDYSGIHYDFGYMRKPIIYYQPKEIPMRFEEGGMIFATMGFGPVCTEYEDAVRLICESMEHQCVMPDEYKKRADDFFAFDDHNNCKRIHEAVLAWVERMKNNNAIS